MAALSVKSVPSGVIPPLAAALPRWVIRGHFDLHLWLRRTVIVSPEIVATIELMHKQHLATLGLWLAIFSATAMAADGAVPARWSWQEPYTDVDPKGDLAWTPRSFVFEKGSSVRYIDFEAGDDANSGDAAETPWKHHPWDPQAAAKAAACSGIHTYVFKRGVAYRGRLVVKDAGQAGNPIRLTSDPAWGKGEAVFCGSERVTVWKKGGVKDMPEPEKV
jgi:hypothetical protein